MPALPLNAERVRSQVAGVDAALEFAVQTRTELRRGSTPGDPDRDRRLIEALDRLRGAMADIRSTTGSLGQGASLPKSLELTADDIFRRSREADKERRRLRAMLKTR